ncbi:SDR family oxidoreductase [Parapedobacter indicus]|uniref:NADP-dependent 3-hydroxy acid dehydrogenase YdfG n=1 Tax=Parapedobacter indicus TaxID=1477437 RepID=A0A1I3CRQ9_9SPHI|nr:SDR family oxidoreductase [Parapedobacter indicus]PPL04364.1 NADP-dependent 3-hydroxy acid dehydrogenase YdfG [Parapedobacter indicus]SFH77006.1 NADP-dependent 3-hydroxy acid dehydrogenase YdfG [Parapedobacter indicus]
MSKKTAFITGASAGIGEACASVLAREGYDLLLAARRIDRLTELSDRLIATYGIKTHLLALDVRNADEVFSTFSNLPSEWQQVDVLINNAGLSQGLDPIQEGDIGDWDRMIDTNLKGLLYVTRAVAPIMAARNEGHIINIGSIAGKEVYPNGNVYCATKYAVDALTKGMRIDLLNKHVKVTAIHPGMVETEFSVVRFKGDEERAAAVYQNLEPLVANDIAEAVWFAVSRPRHVNINDLVIMPTAQATATLTVREN